MDMLASSHIDQRSRIVALAHAELEARRIAISRELATIPPPVPACDVDFNRLLEDRGRVADDLLALDRLLASGAGEYEIAAFCGSSEFLSDALKRELASLLPGSVRSPR